MRIHQIISEAPLVDYEPLGDFEKPGSFNDPRDKKLAVHPVNIQKMKNFFANSQEDFRFFAVNYPGLRRYSEYGAVDDTMLRDIFLKKPEIAERILAGHNKDTITVVFVSNTGDEKIPLTPWIMAHRLGHAIWASSRRQKWKTVEWFMEEFEFAMNLILEDYYGIDISRSNESERMRLYYAPIFNAIGTQQSSRRNLIKRPFEFVYEMLAQYLQRGHVKLNPLPRVVGYGRKTFGRNNRNLKVYDEYTDYDLQSTTESFANTMHILFNSILGECEGKIFLM